MSNNNRIAQIDVWRFLAIFLVVFSHIVKFSHSWYKDVVPGLVWRAQPLGLLGVQLFFCISGFVICRGMLKESVKDGTVNLRAFYIRRVFRILPPLLLYMAVPMLLSLGGVVEVTTNQILPALGFSCNLTVIDCGWLLGHTWSLAFEEQFYLVFPLLFLAAGLATQRNRLFTIAFAMLITGAVARLTGHDTVGYYVSTFSYMVWGCVFALYWDKLQPMLAKVPFPVWLLTALALPGVHVVAMPAVFQQIIYPVIAPLAICIAIFGTPAHHVMARPVFTNTWFAYLGRISYSIYLWQQLATGNLGLSSPVYALLFIPCVLFVAHLSFRYVEMPMVGLGAGFAARSRKQPQMSFDDPLAPRNDTYWRS